MNGMCESAVGERGIIEEEKEGYRENEYKDIQWCNKNETENIVTCSLPKNFDDQSDLKKKKK